MYWPLAACCFFWVWNNYRRIKKKKSGPRKKPAGSKAQLPAQVSTSAYPGVYALHYPVFQY